MESPTRRRRLSVALRPADGWKAAALRHVWLLPVLLAGLWLRLASLGQEHLYGDEAEYAIVARYLSRDATFLAYPAIEGMGPTPFVSQPPLVLYVMALSMKLFGATDFAAILPSVLFGAATIVAVYALGSRLGGRFVGLGAAALVAVMPFHIEMSRRAMLDAGYVFFLVLTAYFLVAWLQERTRGHALGVGAAAAATCLSKLPGIVVAPAVVAVFLLGLGLAVASRDKARVKETLVQGGIGAAPVAVGAFAYLALLWSIQAISNLWLKLRWQFGRFDTSQAEVKEITAIERPWSWYFTDPEFSFQEQLGGLVFALALVGLVVALWLLLSAPTRRPEQAVVPLMVLTLLAFFLYSDRKEGFYLLPFAPFAAVFVGQAGQGLRAMLDWAGLRFAPHAAPRFAPAALAIGLVLVAFPAYSAATYSYTHFVLGEDQEKYFGYGTREAAHWIHENDPEAIQYGTLLGRFSLHWYNEQPAYHWYLDHTFVESQIESGNLRYVVYEDYLQLAFDREYMKELINKYDGEAVQTYRAGWGEVTVFKLNP